MALYTSTYLKQLAESKRKFINDRKLTLAERADADKTFDIFLCHGFLDESEVDGIYVELTNLGLEVYVDWIVDPHLDRTNVTKQSAELIRSRMKASKTLLFAISENAAMSKWMPWELGFVDACTGRCAIFPVSKNIVPQKTFKRWEYLLLYPYVKRAAIGTLSEKVFITESQNQYVEITSWVKRNAKPEINFKNIDEL